MHTWKSLITLALLAATAAASALADTGHATTPRGARLELVTNFPTGPGPFPTVVLAPGQGYHLALPALEKTAQQLVGQGMAVYRFNWAYFSQDAKAGRPSADLSLELEDLQTVLALARAEPRVAKGQISVGGKSLGSIVSWKAFTLDPSLRAGVFLTPVCSRVVEGQAHTKDYSDLNYPGLATERRPLLFVAGDRDPLCATPVLYAFAAKAQDNARVAIVGGDHGFENKALKGSALDAWRDRTVQLVAMLSTGFLAEHSGN